MPSQQSLKWLTTFLATVATVSALPANQKRDWITATIDGQVVSWPNDPAPTPTPAPGGAVWVSAVIDGQTVSWIYGPAPAPAATSSAPATSAQSTTAIITPPPSTQAQAAPTCAPYIYATINGVLASWPNTYCTPAATPAPAPTTSSSPPPPPPPPPPAGPTNAASCKDVHIFIAKGNNEPYPGRQGTLVDAICNGLPSCDYENILYDNTLGIDYCVGVTQGSSNGLAQMTAYAQTCPLSKLVVSGYSQGTDIIGNMLGGGGSVFGVQKCVEGYNPSLSPYTSPGNQIGAALFFGNTRHVANQTYNVLNGSYWSSDNPRYPESLANMNLFSDKIRDYCDETDPVCCTESPGPFIIANHLNYFDRYSNDAADWVKAKLGF